MAHRFRLVLLFLVLGASIPPRLAAAAAVPEGQAGLLPSSGEPGIEMEEVKVIGKTLRALKREAIEAEDRFFKRFNSLNTNDDFDIHCRMDKATGSKVPQRQCRIQFLMEAGAIDAREFLTGLGNGGSGVNTPIATLQPLWLNRREEYRQTARALMEKDPELLSRATEWVRLREQYDRVRKERHKDGIVQF